MQNLNLLTENSRNFSSLDELEKLYSEYVYEESEPFHPSQVSLQTDGTYAINGQEVAGTYSSLKGLCKLLRIPNPFASRIPVDLLQRNIDRLSEEANFEIKTITRKDGNIANFVKEDFVSIPHQMLFEPLANKYGSADVLEGKVSDNWLALSLTKGEDEFFKSFEGVSPNDKYDMGVVVINSPTGHMTTQARVLLHRLICMNQVVGPSNFDIVKCRPKPNRQLEKVVDNFVEGISKLYCDVNSIESAITSLDRSIKPEELKSIFNAVKKITGDVEFVDSEIFGLDPDDRKEILTNLKKYKQGQIEAPPEPQINLYDVFNNITEQAKTFEQEERYKLESYAGKLISN